MVGDIINYTITVENKGGQTITGVSLVDTLTDNNGVSLNLTAGPVFVSSTAGSSQGSNCWRNSYLYNNLLLI